MSTEKATEVPLLSVKATEKSTASSRAPVTTAGRESEQSVPESVSLTQEEAKLLLRDMESPGAFSTLTDAEMDVWDNAVAKLRRISESRMTHPADPPEEVKKETPIDPWNLNDPHGADIEWRASPGSGAIRWRGRWAANCVQRYWSSDLSAWVITPERVVLWCSLQSAASPLSSLNLEKDKK